MRSKQMLVRCGLLAVVVMSTCVSAAPSPGQLWPGLASGLASLEVTQIPQLPTPILITNWAFDWHGRLWLWLSCQIPGAVMRYTLDGSNPKCDSPICDGLLILRGHGTVKVQAFAPGLHASAILEIHIH